MKKILLSAFIFFAITSNSLAQVRKLNAGEDQTISPGEVAHLKGKATNVKAYTWTTSGSGKFSKKHALVTDYIPSKRDIKRGKANLTLSSRDKKIRDTMKLNIKKCGTVNAGDDVVACGYQWGGEIPLTAIVSNNTDSITWSTNGYGGFDNPNAYSTTYYYDASDVNLAVIEVYATINGSGCNGRTDTVQINLQAAPHLEFPEPYVQQMGTEPVYANVYLYGYASEGTWTTSGSGYFENPGSTFSAYYPSANDVANGCVEMIFTTNDPDGPCTPTSGSMTACFNPISLPCPTVDIGGDRVECGYLSGGGINLEASISDYVESITWSSSGNGGFSDANAFSTTYYYDATDVNNASVQIYATVSNSGCSSSAGIVVNLQSAPHLEFPEPYVYQNGSEPVYANVYLYGYASSGTWTSSGTGTFENSNSTYSAYYPSAEDALYGCVQLTFTTNDPDGPCGPTSGSMTACFNQVCPEVNIGDDIVECASSAGGEIYLQATTTTYAESITWSTNGAGSFSDPNAFTTTYQYDPSDVNNAFIEIYATVSSFGCYNSDNLMIHLQATPELVFPEPNVYTCAGGAVYANVYLYGYASSGTWTTSGTGTFQDPNSTYTAYYPGIDEIGCTTLIFTSNDPEGPCGSTSGYMEACFEECSSAAARANVLEVELHPNPTTDKLELKTDVVIDKSKTYITNLVGNRIDFRWNGNDINVSTLQPGNYLLHVISLEGGLYTLRFIKL